MSYPATPTRPKRHSPDIRIVAVKDILPAIKNWLGKDARSDGRIIAELLNAADEDAYHFARNLEEQYWSPDAELVDVLGGFDTYTAHDAAVKAWVVEHGVTIAQGIGDVVTLRSQQARIVALRHDRAEIIAQPLISDGHDYGETGGWVHPAEDAKPAVESAPSVSEER